VRQLAFDIQGPSRRLHKSQITFHRDVAQFHWVDATQGPTAAAEHIVQCFSLPEHEGGGNVASMKNAAVQKKKKLSPM
jgi:hypothetical protein